MSKPSKWSHSAVSERKLRIALRKILNQSKEIIDAHIGDDLSIVEVEKMSSTLAKYGDLLSTQFIPQLFMQVSAAAVSKNMKAWNSSGEAVGAGIKQTQKGILNDPVMGQMRRDQIQLIKDLPSKFGQHVIDKSQYIRDLAREKAEEAVSTGSRAGELASDVLSEYQKAGAVNLTESMQAYIENKADLISVTEVAKANAMVTERIARNAGVSQYIWRTVEDSSVRDEHADMDGKVCTFGEDPGCADGSPGPGLIYRCRCYAEPIIPEDIG